MAVGSVAQQLLRLAHAEEVHGLELHSLCEGCKDKPTPDGCATCGGEGHMYRLPRPEPCGPDCPLLDVRAV